MMFDLLEVRSITEFQRDLELYFAQLKEKRTPIVLTMNGRAEVVVQDAEGYQALLDRLERAETLAALREALAQAKRGEGIPLEQAEQRLRDKHGFSR